MAFFHFPPYRKYRLQESKVPDPIAYRMSLMQLDRTVGALVDILRSRGLWDETLLMISSDHGWRLDEICAAEHLTRRLEERIQHVPLFIKFPLQDKPAIEPRGVELTSISRFFEGSDSGSICSGKTRP